MLVARLPILLFYGALCKRVEYLNVLATLTIGQQKFLNCVLNSMYSYKYLRTNGNSKFI